MKILRHKEKRLATYFGTSWKKLAALSLGGIAAGFFNGLLGAGGGIILVLTFSSQISNDEEGARSVFANALCVMLPLSLVTLLNYAKRDVFSPDFSGELDAVLSLGAIVGGVLGGVLLGRGKSKGLARLFAALTLISGILMIMR